MLVLNAIKCMIPLHSVLSYETKQNGGDRTKQSKWETQFNKFFKHSSVWWILFVPSKHNCHSHSLILCKTCLRCTQLITNIFFGAFLINVSKYFSILCYFELRRLASIRRFLTSTATATLLSAFVLSRIDYCNSLLFFLLMMWHPTCNGNRTMQLE